LRREIRLHRGLPELAERHVVGLVEHPLHVEGEASFPPIAMTLHCVENPNASSSTTSVTPP